MTRNPKERQPAVGDNVRWLADWARIDSLVQLDRVKLRDMLEQDIGRTGTPPMSEDECEAMVCGGRHGTGDPVDVGGVPTGLIERFPATHAWLAEHW